MRKTLGAISLVAGTTIGSGMLALPVILGAVGLIPSLLVMFLTWLLSYYSALINLELNLQFSKGAPLGVLGRHFSGKVAAVIGTVCLDLFSYVLLAAYLYGITSVIQEFALVSFSTSYSFRHIASIGLTINIIVLLLPARWIDYANRGCFIALLGVALTAICGLVISADCSNMPLFEAGAKQFHAWQIIIPVLFNSFGFQVIFHTLSNYCDMDQHKLKKAFFWGSFIPFIVYALWVIGSLSVLSVRSPAFYAMLVQGHVDIASLISELSTVSHYHFMRQLSWLVSILALITSVIGVSLAIFDIWQSRLQSCYNRLSNELGIMNITYRSIGLKLVSAAFTALPPYFVVTAWGQSFLETLGLAGLLLVLIALALPLFLLSKVDSKHLFYPLLKSSALRYGAGLSAMLIVLCEVYQLFM